MKRNLISLAVAGALGCATVFTPAPAFAQSAEIEALKAQLAALSSKIEQLEKSQAQTKKAVEETQATSDKTADVVAQEKSRLTWAGD
jgi:septal ring factor EnvC (AmiA/AmiB activator)